MIGREDLIDDPRFATPRGPLRNHKDESTRCLTPWITQHDKHEVMEMLGDAGVPAGAVFDTNELLDDPHLREARHVRARCSTRCAASSRCRAGRSRCPTRTSRSTSAPLLGEHNEEVYTDIVGSSGAGQEAEGGTGHLARVASFG